jgi:hypothetical protein
VFSVGHNAYFPLTDSLIFRGDTSLVISLTRKLAGIRFEVCDSSGPLANAVVSLNGWEVSTDAQGSVWFSNQMARNLYRYAVSMDGYNPVIDSLFLEIDTTLSVMLQPATGWTSYRAAETEVFPNPASEKLYIRSGPDNGRVMLISPAGKVIIETTLRKGLNGIDVSGLPPGFYYIRIKTRKSAAYGKVVVH